jgi:hypothetical protein
MAALITAQAELSSATVEVTVEPAPGVPQAAARAVIQAMAATETPDSDLLPAAMGLAAVAAVVEATFILLTGALVAAWDFWVKAVTVTVGVQREIETAKVGQVVLLPPVVVLGACMAAAEV